MNAKPQPYQTYIVFEESGFGLVESPLQEGRSIGVFTGTETEVQVFCETKTRELHPKMTGWDSPQIKFKPAIQLNAARSDPDPMLARQALQA